MLDEPITGADHGWRNLLPYQISTAPVLPALAAALMAALVHTILTTKMPPDGRGSLGFSSVQRPHRKRLKTLLIRAFSEGVFRSLVAARFDANLDGRSLKLNRQFWTYGAQ